MFKKEILIFLTIFLLLALGMHMNQWLTQPFEHILKLQNHKMPYHPLLYTSLVYIVIFIIRFLLRSFSNLFKKK